MSSTKKSGVQIRTLLQSLGCTDIECETGGKHLKWRFKTPGGHPATSTTSVSSSDHRAFLNQRSIVRSIIREKDGSH